MKKVTLTFSFEDNELEEFVAENGHIDDWAFGVICQSHDFGFLTSCTIEDVRE